MSVHEVSRKSEVFAAGVTAMVGIYKVCNAGTRKCANPKRAVDGETDRSLHGLSWCWFGFAVDGMSVDGRE